MKKLVKLLLVGLMSLTCVACANNNKEDQVWSDQLIKEGELVVVQGNVKIQNNSPIKVGVISNK